MPTLPHHLRVRVAALGELSRPLGEARAATLARAVVTDLVAELGRAGDAERVLDQWIRRLAAEIVAKSPPPVERRRKPRPRPLADVLPEVRA